MEKGRWISFFFFSFKTRHSETVTEPPEVVMNKSLFPGKHGHRVAFMFNLFCVLISQLLT